MQIPFEAKGIVFELFLAAGYVQLRSLRIDKKIRIATADRAITRYYLPLSERWGEDD